MTINVISLTATTFITSYSREINAIWYIAPARLTVIIFRHKICIFMLSKIDVCIITNNGTRNN